jgi:hypothetical protein
MHLEILSETRTEPRREATMDISQTPSVWLSPRKYPVLKGRRKHCGGFCATAISTVLSGRVEIGLVPGTSCRANIQSCSATRTSRAQCTHFNRAWWPFASQAQSRLVKVGQGWSNQSNHFFEGRVSVETRTKGKRHEKK